jgi:hypothetical protein
MKTSSEVAFVPYAEAEDGGLSLPGEVVAGVGVAVSAPQAPVKWKRVIQLRDLRARVRRGLGALFVLQSNFLYLALRERFWS